MNKFDKTKQNERAYTSDERGDGWSRRTGTGRIFCVHFHFSSRNDSIARSSFIKSFLLLLFERTSHSPENRVKNDKKLWFQFFTRRAPIAGQPDSERESIALLLFVSIDYWWVSLLLTLLCWPRERHIIKRAFTTIARVGQKTERISHSHSENEKFNNRNCVGHTFSRSTFWWIHTYADSLSRWIIEFLGWCCSSLATSNPIPNAWPLPNWLIFQLFGI